MVKALKYVCCPLFKKQQPGPAHHIVKISLYRPILVVSRRAKRLVVSRLLSKK